MRAVYDGFDRAEDCCKVLNDLLVCIHSKTLAPATAMTFVVSKNFADDYTAQMIKKNKFLESVPYHELIKNLTFMGIPVRIHKCCDSPDHEVQLVVNDYIDFYNLL